MQSRLLVLLLLFLPVTSALSEVEAQQLADELSRREALKYYRQGQEFLSGEQFDKAAEAFQNAIDKDPLLAVAHYGLGQSYMALKRYASAVVAFRGSRGAYERLATLAQRDQEGVERQRADEIRELRESMRLIQSGKVKTANANDVSHEILKLENRIRDLERTQRRNVDVFQAPAEVSLALGSAHFRNGDLESAEREWKAAVTANPRFGEAHNNLAALYAMTRRKKEAEGALREAERSGYRVNPQLKADIRTMASN